MRNIHNQILLILILVSSCGEIKQPPGVLAPDKPVQTKIAQHKTWEKDEYHFTALAKIDLRAKVLGKERYRYDRESDIAQYDLALGWGRMSDQTVVDRLDINQRSR